MPGMLELTFEIMGVQQIGRSLGVASDAAKNLRPVWDDIADDFAKRNQATFSREGEKSEWDKWAAISPEYRAWKQSHGFSSRILQKTGALMRSLARTNHPDFVYRPEAQRVTLGTRVPYAKYHQTGYRSRSGSHVPKREPIRITDAQRKHWAKLIQKFLVESGQFERVNL